jgi:hypothetical protein
MDAEASRTPHLVMVTWTPVEVVALPAASTAVAVSV